MGKLEKLRKNGLGNAAESMGVSVPVGSRLRLARCNCRGAATLPAQLQGVSRNKDAALIPTDKIGPTRQPREEFDDDEL